MRKILFLSFALLTLMACNKKNTERSTATGWNYNDKAWGGFIKSVTNDQIIGPNLVPIEGGMFTMGMVDEDVMFDYNNMPRKVTVNSFFMDETEVTNLHYREYVYWVDKVMGEQYPDIVDQVRPDTLVWRDELSYNEPQVENYFSFAAYNDYPVVGVSWEQANDFAKWRSDRVNEMLLVRKGVIQLDENQTPESNFNTDAYLLGKYEATEGENPMTTLNSDSDEAENRRVTRGDGILLPNYRLPTEAEWEYAALATVSNLIDESAINEEKKLYPWEGDGLRAQKGRDRGEFMANFRRGRGDLMGVAGALNDQAAYTANVYSYAPNAFGLFNMAGNVNEWVADVYRPLSPQDVEDFSPYRGNVFERKVKDENGEYVLDSLGNVATRPETDEEVKERKNYSTADARNYKDGDEYSGVSYGYGKTTLINDYSRVYKGGSWNDRPYFLTPGTRRFLQQDMASSTIGFRCAMDMIGGPEGNVITSGQAKKNLKRVKKNRRAREKSIKGKKGLFNFGKRKNKKSKQKSSSGAEE